MKYVRVNDVGNESQVCRSLYAEFDDEERELARAGLGHYAETLREDEACQNEPRSDEARQNDRAAGWGRTA